MLPSFASMRLFNLPHTLRSLLAVGVCHSGTAKFHFTICSGPFHNCQARAGLTLTVACTVMFAFSMGYDPIRATKMKYKYEKQNPYFFTTLVLPFTPNEKNFTPSPFYFHTSPRTRPMDPKMFHARPGPAPCLLHGDRRPCLHWRWLGWSKY